VTNNIVCSSCGGAGHIARDCRQKRPGTGGPNAAGDKNKIDEEVIVVCVSGRLIAAKLREVIRNNMDIYVPVVRTQFISLSPGFL
jgi:hypothetical protein